MAIINFVQTATADNLSAVNPTVVPLPLAQSVGDLLLIISNTDPALTPSTPTDTVGNKYYPIGTAISDADYSQTVWVCLSAKAAGANANSVTQSQTGGTPGTGTTSVRVYHFSPQAGYVWVIDQFTHASGNSTAVNPGTFSTRYPNEVAFAKSGVSFHDTAGAGGSWVTTANDGLGDASQYLITTSLALGANISGSFTQSGANTWVCSMASIAAVATPLPVEWWFT